MTFRLPLVELRSTSFVYKVETPLVSEIYEIYEIVRYFQGKKSVMSDVLSYSSNN